MRLFCVVAIFLLLNSPAATKQQQEQPEKQNAVASQPTNSTPVTVIVNQSPSPEKKDQPCNQSHDWIGDFISLALVGVAFWGAIVARDSLREVRRQADSTEKAANAARDNALAVLNAERAWIMTELTWDPTSPKVTNHRSTVGEITSESISVNVLLKCSNEGKSVAWITEKWAIMKAFTVVSPQPEFTNKESLFQRSMQPLVPHKPEENGHRIWLSVPGTDADRARVTIVIYGYVRYRTIFENKMGETRFGYIVTRGNELERLSSDYPEYNKNT